MINRIIKFGATWCGPCKMMDASLKEFQQTSDIFIESYDVEQDSDKASEFGVRNVPVTFFMHNDTIVGKKVGAMTPFQITEYIKELTEEK